MEPRLEARLLFPWRLLAVVPRQHALARGRTVDIARLAREPVLTLPAGFGTRALFDAGCEMIGARPLIRMEAAGAQTLVAAAKAGYGVAIVPSLLIMDRRGMKALPVLVGGKSLGRWLAIAWDGGRLHPPYLAGLADVLATALARIFPGHEYGFAPPIKAPEASRKPARAS
jgi:DNA-binding transcriptional LysR family regulator